MVKNPYEILGISQGASMDEIKRAYRKKAKEYHPDLHPDDPKANERMQEVNQAYDMLCNPGKYRSEQQASPDYGQYGNTAYGQYNRRAYGGQYQSAGRQYTYSYSNAGGDRNAFRQWQRTWNAQADEQPRQSAAIVHPFRGLLRIAGGLLALRFVTTLLRLLFFGFFM